MAPRAPKKSPDKEGTGAPEALATEPAAPTAPAPPPKPAMTNLQRVKLMNNLVAAVENQEIIEAFKKLPDGEKIFDIFMKAVDDEVAVLMGGEDADENLRASEQVGEQLRQAALAIGQFHQAVAAISRSPIMEVLNRLVSGGVAPRQPQRPVTAPGPADGPDVLHPDAIEDNPTGRRTTGQRPNYIVP